MKIHILIIIYIDVILFHTPIFQFIQQRGFGIFYQNSLFIFDQENKLTNEKNRSHFRMLIATLLLFTQSGQGRRTTIYVLLENDFQLKQL